MFQESNFLRGRLHMKILIIASTSAQLMNAMTLSRTEFVNDKVDLTYGLRIENQVEAAYKRDYFNATYKIPSIEEINNMDTLWKKVRGTITSKQRWKELAKEYPVDTTQYDRILIPGIALSYFIHFYSIHNSNLDIKLSLYEEGICEYYTLGIRDKKKRLLHKLLFGEYYYEKCDSIYVHHPEIVENIWNNIEVKKIDSPIGDDVLCRDLINILGYRDSRIKQLGYQYIFVDAAHPTMKDETEREKRQREALDFIVSIVGKDKVAIKLHPASSSKKYGDDFNYLDFNYPLELIGLRENIDNLTFVSIASSVTVNFKLLLDLEPNVVILQNVLLGSNDLDKDKKVSDLFYRVKETYSKEKFFIPSSYDELKECIKRIQTS